MADGRTRKLLTEKGVIARNFEDHHDRTLKKDKGSNVGGDPDDPGPASRKLGQSDCIVETKGPRSSETFRACRLK